MKAIQTRKSIRRYQEKAVSQELVTRIVEAARMAPSGNNTQPWRFIVIRDDETKEKIIQVEHNQIWMKTAPVFIACIADLEARLVKSEQIWIDEHSELPEVKLIIRDTTIAIEHMVLEAEDLGLGTCWTAWYEQEKIKEVLRLPDNKYVVAVLTLGYPELETSAKATPRKPLDSLVYYEKWGNTSADTK